jgi:hypothetical protein
MRLELIVVAADLEPVVRSSVTLAAVATGAPPVTRRTAKQDDLRAAPPVGLVVIEIFAGIVPLERGIRLP